MKAPHLLRVAAPPEAFAALFAAAREAGLRLGWLELAPPQPLPSPLEAAAAHGAMRAVAVGEGRSLALKPLAGQPVLQDLLREHFLGSTAVLVWGEGGVRQAEALEQAPRIEPQGDRWRLTAGGGGAAESLATEALLRRLRSPLPLAP